MTGSEQNTIFGAGNIIKGGTFTDSPVTTVSGDHNQTVITNAQHAGRSDPREKLAGELARIRKLLETRAGAATATDRDNAIEAIADLQRQLANPQQAEPGKLRRGVKALVGVLLPVSGLIGGVAALEAILRQL